MYLNYLDGYIEQVSEIEKQYSDVIKEKKKYIREKRDYFFKGEVAKIMKNCKNIDAVIKTSRYCEIMINIKLTQLELHYKNLSVYQQALTTYTKELKTYKSSLLNVLVQFFNTQRNVEILNSRQIIIDSGSETRRPPSPPSPSISHDPRTSSSSFTGSGSSSSSPGTSIRVNPNQSTSSDISSRSGSSSFILTPEEQRYISVQRLNNALHQMIQVHTVQP